MTTLAHENGKVPAVVVGVDGSQGGSDALRWAFTEARLRKAPLRIIHALELSRMAITPGGYGYFGVAGPVIDAFPGELRGAAQTLLDDAVNDLAHEFTDVAVERQVIDGQAADVLIAGVNEQDLLVVGSRGHGGVAELLLGSVSQACVHHAPCPVVVVHPVKLDGVADGGVSAAAGASPLRL